VLSSVTSLGLSSLFNFAPSRRLPEPQVVSHPGEDGVVPGQAQLDSCRRSGVSSRSNSPHSPGGLMDDLLNDLYTDLGVDADFGFPSLSARDKCEPRAGARVLGIGGASASRQPSAACGVDAEGQEQGDASASYMVEAVSLSTSQFEMKELREKELAKSALTSKPCVPWSSKESSLLRRVVKQVVKGGTKDKDALWIQVSKEMGGQREARECRLQYARDYKAHKASA